jgi:hypothetical protein
MSLFEALILSLRIRAAWLFYGEVAACGRFAALRQYL